MLRRADVPEARLPSPSTVSDAPAQVQTRPLLEGRRLAHETSAVRNGYIYSVAPAFGTSCDEITVQTASEDFGASAVTLQKLTSRHERNLAAEALVPIVGHSNPFGSYIRITATTSVFDGDASSGFPGGCWWSAQGNRLTFSSLARPHPGRVNTALQICKRPADLSSDWYSCVCNNASPPPSPVPSPPPTPPPIMPPCPPRPRPQSHLRCRRRRPRRRRCRPHHLLLPNRRVH